MGIPHSAFLGWDVDDQDKALAWQQVQRTTCSGCGTRPEEWDPTVGGDRYAYVADARRCPGCEVLAQAQRDLSREQTDDTLGVRLGLVRNTDDDEGGG